MPEGTFHRKYHVEPLMKFKFSHFSERLEFSGMKNYFINLINNRDNDNTKNNKDKDNDNNNDKTKQKHKQQDMLTPFFMNMEI